MALTTSISGGFLAAVWLALPATNPPIVQLGPGVFRAQVKMGVTPTYPVESIRAGHTGIAVADVHVSTTGTVLGVKVLQSPDTAIHFEIAKTLLTWKFLPTVELPGRTPVEIEGRVIFSFSLKGGKPQVLDLVARHAGEASDEKK